MKLESQVTSLEISKRMKELGAPQESLFWWSENEFGGNGWEVYFKHQSLGMDDWFTVDKDKHISAYTVAELGEMLPDEMADEHEDFPYYFTCTKFDGFWLSSYVGDRGKIGESFEGNTEADARAKMWIYLKRFLPKKKSHA